MRNKIFTADSDSQAIVLFGTKMSEPQENKYGVYPDCYVLHDLQKPEAESIRKIEKLLENTNHLKSAATNILSLADPFW